MSYRSSLFLIPALSFVLSVSAIADITLNNGADINMNGSPGSTIIFPDSTVLSTASGMGADGADGSDAAVPTGHGGTGNTVTGSYAFVGGGYTNTADGDFGTVGGGYTNTASGLVSLETCSRWLGRVHMGNVGWK